MLLKEVDRQLKQSRIQLQQLLNDRNANGT